MIQSPLSRFIGHHGRFLFIGKESFIMSQAQMALCINKGRSKIGRRKYPTVLLKKEGFDHELKTA